MRFPERPKYESATNTLRLKAGESVVGVFRGDPVTFEQHYSQTERRGTVCLVPLVCPKCVAGDFPKFRFKINFLSMENNSLVAKIFVQGGMVYDLIGGLLQSGYNLDEHFVKISRTGDRQQTKYTVVPLPKGQITDAQRNKILSVPLIDLKQKPQAEDTSWGQQEEAPTFASSPNNDEIPF